MRMNSPEGKSILALIRGGAFAHAGETEAIEMALATIPKDTERAVLDVGCGLGGTADYVRQHGWGNVTGFDIDSTSVERAKVRFPQCTFVASDVGSVGQHWKQAFDLIYCFNAFYAFPQQETALAELGKVARPGAKFLIFDYTDPEQNYADSKFARREEASFWQPIHSGTLEKWAASTGWQMISSQDITSNFLRWYDELGYRIKKHRDEVVASHGEPAFGFVRTFYQELRDAIADGIIGGGIFTLIRNDFPPR